MGFGISAVQHHSNGLMKIECCCSGRYRAADLCFYTIKSHNYTNTYVTVHPFDCEVTSLSHTNPGVPLPQSVSHPKSHNIVSPLRGRNRSATSRHRSTTRSSPLILLHPPYSPEINQEPSRSDSQLNHLPPLEYAQIQLVQGFM